MLDKNKVLELIQAYDEYLKLLNLELNELASLTRTHGWSSSRYEAGVLARDKIAKIKNELLKPQGGDTK